jgi:hypothetical protein
MANPEGQPVSAVQQYIDAFNNGDASAMAAMCANPMSILGGMAPAKCSLFDHFVGGS